jgi:hypothetical chaperone protein
MGALALGLDFGTSNTVAAVSDGGAVRVLPLDPLARDTRLFRSVLFFPEEAPYLAGAEAIAAYLELSEGRFLQSLKSFLPVKSFRATAIKNKLFTLEALIALLLRRVREAAERETGGERITRVTLGRPARFGEEAELDAFAELRLRRAAEEAGFKEITFRIEPLAAGLAHEATLTQDQLVLTGDFGAGTSDFTVMRLSPARHKQSDRKSDILASGGVYVGGDLFDGLVMEHHLLPYFGSKATYQPFGGTQRVSLPAYLMRRLLGWHTMSFIRDADTQRFLEDVLRTTDDRKAVGALIDLVNLNLGYHLFRAIEEAKVALSTKSSAPIRFHDARVDLDLQLSRAEFERCIAPGVAQLKQCLDTVLERAQVTPAQIEAVVLTGGSSLIPAISALFDERFGPEKVRHSDAFSSVAEGLAAAAAALD